MKILGIDLGTTNSCAAIIDAGNPMVLPTTLGSRMTKSAVRFLSSGEAIVGEHAYRTRLVDPANTVTSIKRFIGRRYNEVFDIANSVPFNVVIGKNNLALIESYGREYTPQMISAMILRSLKSSAEEYLGEEITDAVITVPAYFSDSQREATREAGEIAGLHVMRIINEPTAAALVYGVDKKEDETIAVFDLGGGTFDISIVDIGEGVAEVKSIAGDNFLGGDDFDTKIVEWLAEEISIERGLNIADDPEAMQFLREAAIKAKIELSSMTQTSIDIPFLPIQGGTVEGINMSLTRQRFEEICAELFERLIEPCEAALVDRWSGQGRYKVERVLLVGGATRMPKISDVIKSVFGVEPNRSVNPDEAVALGAAVQGSVLSGQKTDFLLLDVTPHSLGIESDSGSMVIVIVENTTIPTRKSQIFSTSIDNQMSVEIHVLEGKKPLAIDNRSLGRFTLDDISPAPAGVPQIEVAFDVDANGLLTVRAKNMGTGKEERLVVKASTGLSDHDRAERLRQVREI
jgi:molecular chaperone DnaK